MNMTSILSFDIVISHKYFSWRHQTYWLPRVPKFSWSQGATAGRRIQLLGTTPNNPRLLIAYSWICHQACYESGWMCCLWAQGHSHTQVNTRQILNTFRRTWDRGSQWGWAVRSMYSMYTILPLLQWRWLRCTTLFFFVCTHLAPTFEMTFTKCIPLKGQGCRTP